MSHRVKATRLLTHNGLEPPSISTWWTGNRKLTQLTQSNTTTIQSWDTNPFKVHLETLIQYTFGQIKTSGGCPGFASMRQTKWLGPSHRLSYSSQSTLSFTITEGRGGWGSHLIGSHATNINNLSLGSHTMPLTYFTVDSHTSHGTPLWYIFTTKYYARPHERLTSPRHAILKPLLDPTSASHSLT